MDDMGEADDMGPPHIIQRNDIWDDMAIITKTTNYATSAIKSSN